MKCEEYKEMFAGGLNEDLTPAEKSGLEKHLAECADCREEFAAMQEMWGTMGELATPEPSPLLRVKFQAMLDTYKASEADKGSVWRNIKNQLEGLWQRQPRLPLAYNLFIVILSFGCGYWFFHNNAKSTGQDQQLQALTAQVHDMKQTMMLSLLENPSASERIKGVSYTSEINHADKEVINALLSTLNNDPNVNVRLSTLEALSHLTSHPEVREGLIKSIIQQDSPLMQSAIADVMLKLQEKKSVQSFEELLKQKNLDNGVRDKIKQTITQLI
ncbi:HEAT repeat domain-containing protein [Chitinophagaceae bacterium LWZ2-11]